MTAGPGQETEQAVRGSGDARRRLWARWVGVVTAAELAGFLVPVAAVASLGGDPRGPAALLVLLAAGAGEGAVLGWGQITVVRRVLPGLSRRNWIARTALAAVLAWGIGLSPGLFEETWQGWPPALQLAVAVPAGLLLLVSIGTAQWTVLRRHVAGAGRWIAWTAAGWLAGLSVFLLVATPLWQPGQPTWLIAAIGVLAGGGMALTMAAVTGWGLVRLLTEGPELGSS